MNKVLIIDDDKELCALMKKCVERENLAAGFILSLYSGSLQSFALTEKLQNLIQILHHMSVVTHINLMLRPCHRH